MIRQSTAAQIRNTGFFLLLLFFTILRAVNADTLPQQILLSDLHLYEADSEIIDGNAAGLLLIPLQHPNYRDEKYKQSYHLACHVYIAAPASKGSAQMIYKRRFVVCAANNDALPFVKKVARTLLLLCSERRARIHDDHPTQQPTVNVWVTERVESGLSPDTGGEQFQNQIYLYNWHRDRQPMEWFREIAHEYGHYSLPGISGFKAPEEWANGVLGERLFLKWIREDLHSGRLRSEDLAFGTPELLDDFYGRQIWPLIRRILRDGMDAALITRQDADGMNYYTGLALYIDTLYGTPELVDAMQETHSASSLTFAHASDFLSGFLTALREANDITLNLPAFGNSTKEALIHFYLPAGSWNVAAQGSTLSWHIPPDSNKFLTQTDKGVVFQKPGWHTVLYLRAPSMDLPAQLRFQKRK